MKLEVLLLRHGQTQGNLEKRYIGKTDEPLLLDDTESMRKISALQKDWSRRALPVHRSCLSVRCCGADRPQSCCFRGRSRL